MKRVKVNYQQILDVISMHLEALAVLRHDEHIALTPFSLDKNGMLTVYIHKNKELS